MKAIQPALDQGWELGGVVLGVHALLARGTDDAAIDAVGADFEEYRTWLECNGVDTSWVRVSTTKHTARFLCTTDDYQNQIRLFKDITRELKYPWHPCLGNHDVLGWGPREKVGRA